MPDQTPQFSTAEYVPPVSQKCQLCEQPLATEYYRVRGKQACASCAAQARSAPSGGMDDAFPRALVLGILAAAVSLAIYAAFTIATGFYVGYIALGVGYLIAKAMFYGAGGAGGRPYQITAAVLTYLAIALAEIPIGLWHIHDRYPLSVLLSAGLRMLPMGLISPFLELKDDTAHGLIGLLILFVGIRIAWRLLAGSAPSVTGPYPLTAPAR